MSGIELDMEKVSDIVDGPLEAFTNTLIRHGFVPTDCDVNYSKEEGKGNIVISFEAAPELLDEDL